MSTKFRFILVTIFLDSLGFGLAVPVLPALLGELIPNRELCAYWYGALSVAFGLMQFFTIPFLGALSDRFGRRPILLVAMFGLGLDFFLTANANSVWMLLLARVIGGMTAANYSVATAYIADLTPKEKRSEAFGFVGAVFGIGLIAGPVLGGLLANGGYRVPFYVAACLSLINAAYGLFILPESLPVNLRASNLRSRLNPFIPFSVLWRIQGIRGFVIVYALVMLAQFISQTTWALFNTFRFGWTPAENGISLFVIGVCFALAQANLGLVLKRIGEAKLMLIGLGAGVVAFILYGIAQAGWMMYAIAVITLIGFTTAPLLSGIISKAAESSMQGATIGALNALNSLTSIVGPLVGNLLLGLVSGFSPMDLRTGVSFFSCALLQLAACIIALMIFWHKKLAIREVPELRECSL